MTQMFVAELVAATESAELVAVFDLVVRISILLLASAASIPFQRRREQTATELGIPS